MLQSSLAQAWILTQVVQASKNDVRPLTLSLFSAMPTRPYALLIATLCRLCVFNARHLHGLSLAGPKHRGLPPPASTSDHSPRGLKLSWYLRDSQVELLQHNDLALEYYSLLCPPSVMKNNSSTLSGATISSYLAVMNIAVTPASCRLRSEQYGVSAKEPVDGVDCKPECFEQEMDLQQPIDLASGALPGLLRSDRQCSWCWI